jgi:hypothetical protein
MSLIDDAHEDRGVSPRDSHVRTSWAFILASGSQFLTVCVFSSGGAAETEQHIAGPLGGLPSYRLANGSQSVSIGLHPW